MQKLSAHVTKDQIWRCENDFLYISLNISEKFAKISTKLCNILDAKLKKKQSKFYPYRTQNILLRSNRK